MHVLDQVTAGGGAASGVTGAQGEAGDKARGLASPASCLPLAKHPSSQNRATLTWVGTGHSHLGLAWATLLTFWTLASHGSGLANFIEQPTIVGPAESEQRKAL